MKPVRRVGHLWIPCVLSLLAAAPAAAQPATGEVRGRVFDGMTGAAIASATVGSETAKTTTDHAGAFRLAGVAPGPLKIVVNAQGFLSHTFDIVMAAGTMLRQDVHLLPDLDSLSTFLVKPLQESRMRALGYQRSAITFSAAISADQVGRLPDSIIAEALQRVPGATLERDHGQGRYVGLRGLGPAETSVRVNGSVLLSPEADARPVALDTIPASLVQRIEIDKSALPSMDADGIGGSVNLVTLNAPQRFRALASFAGGYNHSLADAKMADAHGTVGGQLREGRVGLVVSASSSTEPRGTESMEASYDDGAPEEVEFRHYAIARRRLGGSGTLDHRLSASTTMALTGLFTHYRDDEQRQRLLFDLGSEGLERDLKDRRKDQFLGSTRASLMRLFGSRTFDGYISFTHAQEREPDKRNTAFRNERVRFSQPEVGERSVRVAASEEHLSDYALSSLTIGDLFTRGREFSASGNIVLAQRRSLSVTAGAKVRIQTKERRSHDTDYTADDVPFAPFVGPQISGDSFVAGLGAFGPGVSRNAAAEIMAAGGLSGEVDIDEAAQDYRGSEAVLAGYVMGDWAIGERWTLTPGVRIDSYRTRYTGAEVWLREGTFAERVSRHQQTTALPSVHARFKPDSNTLVRMAIGRTLTRPDFHQITPYRTIDSEDREVQLGNTRLAIPTAWTLDLGVERYLEPLGVVSVTAFQKWLRNRIEWVAGEESIGGEVYSSLQPRNGHGAVLRGIELAFENQLSFLPAGLDGLGVYAAYRLSGSSTDADGVPATGPIPGEPKHSGNIEVSYEKRRFSGRVGLNVHGAFSGYTDDVEDAGFAYGTRAQLDASAAVALTGGWRAFVEGINLTNAAVYSYDARTLNPVRVEYYKPVFRFGVRASF